MEERDREMEKNIGGDKMQTCKKKFKEVHK